MVLFRQAKLKYRLFCCSIRLDPPVGLSAPLTAREHSYHIGPLGQRATVLGEVRLHDDWQGMETTYYVLELARLEALGPDQEAKAAQLSWT